MKYNYLILSSPADFYHCVFRDLEGCNNSTVEYDVKANVGWLYPLWKIHTSRKINNILYLPKKDFWNKFIVKVPEFGNTNPVCFVFLGEWVRFAFELGLAEDLKKMYPESKFVWYVTDIVKRITPFYISNNKDGKYPDIERAKKIFDLIISYDDDDCTEYGFLYYPTPYSSFSLDVYETQIKQDVYFCGKAKDRFDDIIRTYEILKQENLTVKFYLTGVEENKQIYTDDITYGPNITYSQVIENVRESKAILEIMQVGAKGRTLRTNEAIAFGKKLLTNNLNIVNQEFYNPAYITCFDVPDNIDRSFLKSLRDNNPTVDFNYMEKLSPVRFIEYIDQNL